MADVAAHHVQRLVVRHGLLVAALRRQRVVDVGDAENARGARNLLALEPVRIAGAVPPLVVRLDDRAHVPREVDVGEHLDARHRVLLDHHPLVRREAARLVQDLRRDHQLADVVQQRADAEPEQRFLVEAGFGGESAGEIGDALAVTLRVVILRFDRLTPASHDVEEIALEAGRLAIDVGEVGPRVQLREQTVRAIQALQRVAIASLQAIELGELARDFRRKQQVLARIGELDGVAECLLGGAEVARLAEDDAVALLDFADGLGVLRLFGDGERAIACLARFREFLPRDPEDRRSSPRASRGRRRRRSAG